MRVFVLCSSAEVAAQVELAREAERAGLDGVWVRGPASPHGDSYATTAAAAVASATEHLRIGVVLSLTAPDDVLRLAEDLAVLDHCSSGRAELCLATSPEVGRLLTNLHTCTVDERQVTVTPGPLQPTIPAVLAGPSCPGVGQVVELQDPPAQVSPDPATRVVLRVDEQETQAVVTTLADPDALAGAVDRLRSAVQACSARDVLFTVPAAGLSTHVDALASVVAPLLRANADEVPDMVLDTLTFRGARAAFDPVPTPAH